MNVGTRWMAGGLVLLALAVGGCGSGSKDVVVEQDPATLQRNRQMKEQMEQMEQQQAQQLRQLKQTQGQ